MRTVVREHSGEADARVWSAVLAHLRERHPTICRQWFDELDLLGVGGGVVRVRAHSDFHRKYLEQTCDQYFREAFQGVTDRLVSVRFLGPDDPAEPPSRPAEGEEPPVEAPRRDSLLINPDNSFENFIIDPNNRLAHAASLAVADRPGQAYNPMFIYGGVGLGKTHLLQAVCLRIARTTPSASLYYISCEGFITQFMEGVQAGQMSSFRHRFRDVDVLVIDDIHFLAKRDTTQEEFFHTFNSLHQSSRQIILSSDAAPEQIPDLEERLVSRFKQGLVTQILPPGYETRVEIVKKKAALRGLILAEDIAAFIAGRIDTNIRELEGAITKVQHLAQVEQCPPDLALAKAALADSPGRIARGPSIQVIIHAVTDFYGVKLTDLQSKRKHRSITLPRQVAMYLARQHTRHSLEEIGGHFGGRDHTTVLNAVQKVSQRRQAAQSFDNEVAALEEKLRDSNTGSNT